MPTARHSDSDEENDPVLLLEFVDNIAIKLTESNRGPIDKDASLEELLLRMQRRAADLEARLWEMSKQPERHDISTPGREVHADHTRALQGTPQFLVAHRGAQHSLRAPPLT